VDRPRILLFSLLTAAEWPVLPEIEEWADVALVTGAWLDDGQAVNLGIEQMDERGWDTAVAVCDEWSVLKAIEFIEAAPDRVLGFAHGHACLELRADGARPTLNAQVVNTYEQLLRTDFRSYARAISQTTRGDLDDAVVDRIISESSHADVIAMFERVRAKMGESFEPVLRAYGGPLLFAWHSECLLWTREGFDDAAKVFPGAELVEVSRKPSASSEFAAVLRRFATDCLSATQ
jgi:hypothetical protein